MHYVILCDLEGDTTTEEFKYRIGALEKYDSIKLDNTKHLYKEVAYDQIYSDEIATLYWEVA